MTVLTSHTRNFLKSAGEIVGSKGVVTGDDLRGRPVDPMRVIPTLARRSTPRAPSITK